MGEMADYALEQVEEMEDLRFRYRTGDMSDDEAFELGIINEMGGYETSGHKHSIKKTCKFCHMNNLYWGLSNNKWRLFEGDSVHICKVNPLIERK